MTTTYFRLFPAEELAPNKSRSVTVEDREILICNAKGEFYGVQDLCTHQRAKLEGGRIRNCFISCPLHGVMFNLQTGVPRGQLTNVPLKTYPVRVVDGYVEVALE